MGCKCLQLAGADMALACIYSKMLTFDSLYLFFAAMPIVFDKGRGWSEGMTGLAFLGILIGILLSAVATFPMYYRYRRRALSTVGRVPPEARLLDTFVGAILLPLGLFWFAWTNSPSIHWIVPIAAGIPFGYGMITVFLPILNYLIDAYTIYSCLLYTSDAADEMD